MVGGIDYANPERADSFDHRQVIVEHNDRPELVEQRLDKPRLKCSVGRVKVTLDAMKHDIVIQPMELEIMQIHIVHGPRGANRDRCIGIAISKAHGAGQRQKRIAEHRLARL